MFDRLGQDNELRVAKVEGFDGHDRIRQGFYHAKTDQAILGRRLMDNSSGGQSLRIGGLVSFLDGVKLICILVRQAILQGLGISNMGPHPICCLSRLLMGG